MTRLLAFAALLAVAIPTIDKAISNTARLAVEYGERE